MDLETYLETHEPLSAILLALSIGWGSTAFDFKEPVVTEIGWYRPLVAYRNNYCHKSDTVGELRISKTVYRFNESLTINGVIHHNSCYAETDDKMVTDMAGIVIRKEWR